MTMSAEREVSYRTLYEEVCRQHDGISDFRAKLLGFLPLASAGALVLLGENSTGPHAVLRLFGTGLFGMFVTIGLFIHEIRGIEKCVSLITAARLLEERLANELEGAFRSKRPGLEVRTPTRIIYFAVALAWAYVAVLAAVALPEALRPSHFAAATVPIVLVLGFIFWGWLELNKEQYRL
jgi:hypothetical protein